ncbi:MAG: hypothetical protein JWQ57_2930 [Mucilaginibacter sp.]|nr:hypothetical protein [Mucilaginibacter sp.]
MDKIPIAIKYRHAEFVSAPHLLSLQKHGDDLSYGILKQVQDDSFYIV